MCVFMESLQNGARNSMDATLPGIHIYIHIYMCIYVYIYMRIYKHKTDTEQSVYCHDANMS